MKLLQEFIKAHDITTTPTGDHEIGKAGEKLSITFTHQYRTYLKEFGTLSAQGHGICGLGVDKGTWLNVMCATFALREAYPHFPDTAVLLCEIGDDGYYLYDMAQDCVVLWKSSGESFIVKTFFESFLTNTLRSAP